MSRLMLQTDLTVIRNNADVIRKNVSENKKILSVVKADAYGHGSIQVAECLVRNGLTDGFAVATVGEGVSLRKAGIQKTILVLGYVDEAEMEKAVEEGLSLTVYSKKMLGALARVSRKENRTAKAHLKIDTGMNRIGVKGEKELIGILDAWKNVPEVNMEGLYSHFSSADSDEAFTLMQYRAFENAVNTVRAYGFRPNTHIAASSAMTDDRFKAQAVREGIALYGIGYGKIKDMVMPAQKLFTHPVRIEAIEAGESIGYSRAYRAQRDMLVMTLPCGYGDGYPRSLSGRAEVLVDGKRAPVIGNICMDMMMADITGMDNVNIESEVVLMGEQGTDRISPADLADASGTIPYEIMLGFSARVERSWVE